MTNTDRALCPWELISAPAGVGKDGRFAAIGIDIGSTTAKIVVFCDGKLVYSCYERHFSQVRPKTLELLLRVKDMVGEFVSFSFLFNIKWRYSIVFHMTTRNMS